MLEQFGRTMRENFASESIPLRKAAGRPIGAIEIGDTAIRIKGSKDVFEKAASAGRNGATSGSQINTEMARQSK